MLRNDNVDNNNNNNNNKNGLIDELFLLLASQEDDDIELDADAIVSQQTLRLLHKKIINHHQGKPYDKAIDSQTNKTSGKNKLTGVHHGKGKLIEQNNISSSNITSSSL